MRIASIDEMRCQGIVMYGTGGPRYILEAFFRIGSVMSMVDGDENFESG